MTVRAPEAAARATGTRRLTSLAVAAGAVAMVTVIAAATGRGEGDGDSDWILGLAVILAPLACAAVEGLSWETAPSPTEGMG